MYQSGGGTREQIFQQTSTEQYENQFGEALCGAGSDPIISESSAYGEKLLGSGSALEHSNIGRYFSNPQYYFQVNDQYVQNKLKVILYPFLHRGHWMRATETVKGKLRYKPPIDDINDPDLYIPLVAFGTSVVLAGFFLGINGKFTPEALGVQFTNGLLCWLLQVLLMEATLHTLGDGEIPILDVVAYSGYTFVAVSIALVAEAITCGYCYYLVCV